MNSFHSVIQTVFINHDRLLALLQRSASLHLLRRAETALHLSERCGKSGTDSKPASEADAADAAAEKTTPTTATAAAAKEAAAGSGAAAAAATAKTAATTTTTTAAAEGKSRGFWRRYC